MKLIDQCCTLEQGKRLVELGVTAESTFWWMPAKSGPHKEYVQYGNSSDSLAPAYNVAELGELLPHPSGLNELGGWVHMTEYDLTPKDGKPWYCLWEYDLDMDAGGFGRHIIDAVTEAQARADMLIYLLENQIIKPC